jgi:hypothetical protein
MDSFIERDGDRYIIRNPSDPLENFADKWSNHPERKDAFYEWLDQARQDFRDLAHQIEKRRLVESVRPHMGAVANRAATRLSPTRDQCCNQQQELQLWGLLQRAQAFQILVGSQLHQRVCMIWWVEQSIRVQSERTTISDLEERNTWLTNIKWHVVSNLRLAADFDLQVAERLIPLTITYPEYFPDVPPSVVPRDGKRLSDHQYGLENFVYSFAQIIGLPKSPAQ